MDINGTFPQRSCFRVRRGKSYALEGEIAKLHNGRTLIFHAERSAANIEIAGPQLVELGAVKVTGIGTIESLRHLIGTDEEPYWEIAVVDEHRGIIEDAVRVCYIIPADELDVPANTRLRRCSRICLVGEIIEIGGGGNDLTVQVRLLIVRSRRTITDRLAGHWGHVLRDLTYGNLGLNQHNERRQGALSHGTR
ncbi:hypothetical protein MJO29_016323 [Puccinia striiformis f. sp. tritici]|nr:hypothetical protein MJO29_016323 [Puccinia striiformis f. sp. tritici]